MGDSAQENTQVDPASASMEGQVTSITVRREREHTCEGGHSAVESCAMGEIDYKYCFPSQRL